MIVGLNGQHADLALGKRSQVYCFVPAARKNIFMFFRAAFFLAMFGLAERSFDRRESRTGFVTLGEVF